MYRNKWGPQKSNIGWGASQGHYDNRGRIIVIMPVIFLTEWKRNDVSSNKEKIV